MLRLQVTEQKVIMRDLRGREAAHRLAPLDPRRPDQRRGPDRARRRREEPYDAAADRDRGRPNLTTSPGAEGAQNSYNFQYMSDTKAISHALETAKAGVAVGGSFIAYELAEAFVSRNVETHWLIRGRASCAGCSTRRRASLLHDAARADGST